VLGTDLFSIFLIAIGLSADCFAVSLSAGISNKKHSQLQIFRVALSFGFFQGAMPLLGWLAGRTVVDFIADYDHWLAFVLLAIVSSRMFWEAFHSKGEKEKVIDVSRGLLLLTLSIATSIDALAVGLSFAFLEVNITLASLIIGVIALISTIIGFAVGKKSGKLIGKRAEAIGAVILLIIAFRILLRHIL